MGWLKQYNKEQIIEFFHGKLCLRFANSNNDTEELRQQVKQNKAKVKEKQSKFKKFKWIHFRYEMEWLLWVHKFHNSMSIHIHTYEKGCLMGASTRNSIFRITKSRLIMCSSARAHQHQNILIFMYFNNTTRSMYEQTTLIVNAATWKEETIKNSRHNHEYDVFIVEEWNNGEHFWCKLRDVKTFQRTKVL